MSTPIPAEILLADTPAQSTPALIANDAALWVCVHCDWVCCGTRGTIHSCERCGTRYVLQEPTARLRLVKRQS
jgi:hypothetical protein